MIGVIMRVYITSIDISQEEAETGKLIPETEPSMIWSQQAVEVDAETLARWRQAIEQYDNVQREMGELYWQAWDRGDKR